MLTIDYHYVGLNYTSMHVIFKHICIHTHCPTKILHIAKNRTQLNVSRSLIIKNDITLCTTTASHVWNFETLSFLHTMCLSKINLSIFTESDRCSELEDWPRGPNLRHEQGLGQGLESKTKVPPNDWPGSIATEKIGEVELDVE